jgi:hypothetical protein
MLLLTISGGLVKRTKAEYIEDDNMTRKDAKGRFLSKTRCVISVPFALAPPPPLFRVG